MMPFALLVLMLVGMALLWCRTRVRPAHSWNQRMHALRALCGARAVDWPGARCMVWVRKLEFGPDHTSMHGTLEGCLSWSE